MDTKDDVAVIGGGLAGLAVSIHLARSGFRVTCFELVRHFRAIVGESLDWSAPDLLNEISLPMEDLVGRAISTYKRHVVLKYRDDSQAEYIPSEWLARSPLNIELRTMHVDRLRLHANLIRTAEDCGVSMVHDRVTAVERRRKTIIAVQTASGLRLTPKWVVDASGSASSFLGREFQLTSIEYGPKKVAIWSHFNVSDWQEGTTIYSDVSPREYMEWIWEIPINPGTISVGYVGPGIAIKRARARSLSVKDIYQRQLMKFERFRNILENLKPETVNVTSFSCRTFNGVCGPNWIIIGEAASVVDPITGNGVTAALRNAAEAAAIIRKYRNRRRISLWSRIAYSLRVMQMAKFFNSLIEKLAYDWPIRDRMGLLTAGDAYTIPAWSINQLYSRIRPVGMISTALFSAFLMSLRSAAWLFYQLCKLFAPSGCAAPEPTF